MIDVTDALNCFATSPIAIAPAPLFLVCDLFLAATNLPFTQLTANACPSVFSRVSSNLPVSAFLTILFKSPKVRFISISNG